MKLCCTIILFFGLAVSSLQGVSVSSKSQFKGSPRQQDEFLYDVFPDNFLWGFATSSYQIEGGFDADGKGVNIWDTWAHENNGGNIQDGSNGDIACDSYNKYLDDVAILKDMGADFYRFSIAWSRILPTGTESGGVNQAGIDYYNKLIDALLANGIKPFVTMYHWDLPQPLQDIGGWPNEEIAKHFEYYSRILYSAFGDRVKDWITFNEPLVVCQLGYAYGSHAPGIRDPAEKPYQCAHTIIKSHGLAYRVYESEFSSTQNGQVGITLNSDWSEPKNLSNPEDVAASDTTMRFHFGWFANPLFRGEYPAIMRELVDQKSQNEGRNTSRLPSFDENWTQIINGTLDFIGVNHYTSNYVFPTNGGSPGLDGDSNTGTEIDPSWEGTAAPWLKVVPWGFRKLVTWVSNEYGRPPIYITENGSADRDVDSIQDTARVSYYNRYINELLKAIKLDGADVKAYTAWSLMDNYEWAAGYSQRFGTHYVNFTDPNLTRVPKDSAIFLKQLFQDNGFPNATSS